MLQSHALPLTLVLFLTLGLMSFGQAADPIMLFDGSTLTGWTTAEGDPVTEGWTVEDGAIYLESKAGHIYYHQEIDGDFELRFQWKIAAKGNSGLKYRVTRYGNKLLGCEYQLYDDRGLPQGLKSAGALYGLYEPPENKPLNPVGQWNTARIVVRGTIIEHWLNDQRVVRADLDSPQWQERLAASKFSPHPEFARNRSGRIMLQDHGGEVWFKDLQLTPLNEPVATQ